MWACSPLPPHTGAALPVPGGPLAPQHGTSTVTLAPPPRVHVTSDLMAGTLLGDLIGDYELAISGH
ncbi:hypothetical protein [Streptomyces sp. NPDC002550]